MQVGCYADVIAVGDDPLAHVEALKHVDFVTKGGVVYKAAGAAADAPAG